MIEATDRRGRHRRKRLRQSRSDEGQGYYRVARDLQAEIDHRMEDGEDRNSERRNRAR